MICDHSINRVITNRRRSDPGTILKAVALAKAGREPAISDETTAVKGLKMVHSDRTDLAHDAVERLYDGPGRTAWGAILAGTVVAGGVFVLLALAGLGLGFTLLEPDEASPMNGAFTTTAIWQFVSQLIALAAGGFVAGRLAGVLHGIGAALHGATVWGLSTLLALWLAISATAGLFSMAGSAISSIASGVGSAAQAAIPEDLSLPDLSVSGIDMQDLPEPLRRTLRENGITPDNFQREAREAFRSVISAQEQARIRQQATEAAGDLVGSPGDAREDVNDFVDSVFGQGAILSEEDREEAIAVMEGRFGITEAEAEEFLQTVETRAEELQAEAEEALQQAQEQAAEAADTATDAIASAAWLAALASLIGLAAAVGGAIAGRPSRA
jgi:hypothetical protein